MMALLVRPGSQQAQNHIEEWQRIASHLKKENTHIYWSLQRSRRQRSVEIPFDWPLTENFTKSVNGQFELSTVTLQIKFNQ